jgi:hypothetical protein
MKFTTFTLSLIAGAAMAQEEDRALAYLDEVWSIQNPTFAYTGLDFTFDYAVSNVIDAGQAYYEVYHSGCKVDGTLVVVGEGFNLDTLVDVPSGIQTDPLLFNVIGKTATVPIGIDVNTITASPGYSGTGTGADLSAIIVFCVRFGLNAAGPSEVNFLESVVTMTAALANGFTIDAINGVPKALLANEAAKVYTVSGYMCEPGSDAGVADPLAALNQGSLITVCIKPDAAGVLDGIKMRTVDSFGWTRDGTITQAAITGGAAAGNLLTTFDASTCSAGDDFCQFSSILFAEFYATSGTVVGDGVAPMQFGTRRLADNAGGLCSLQVGEAAATSAFDLSVQIEGADNDGPGAYETTAGASMSTMFAAMTAIVGAVSVL